MAWLAIIIWSFYPIVWLFSEGFASFSVSFEVPTPSPTPSPGRGAEGGARCACATQSGGTGPLPCALRNVAVTCPPRAAAP